MLSCFDADTGDRVWRTDVTGGDFRGGITVADGRVYAGNWDHNLYCFDAEGNGDGTTDLIWSYQTGNRISVSTPAVADGKVYVGSSDGYLFY